MYPVNKGRALDFFKNVFIIRSYLHLYSDIHIPQGRLCTLKPAMSASTCHQNTEGKTRNISRYIALQHRVLGPPNSCSIQNHPGSQRMMSIQVLHYRSLKGMVYSLTMTIENS